MKYLFIAAGLAGCLLASCQKNGRVAGTATLTADSLTYNTATKTFSPKPEVQGTLQANRGIRQVYYYLLRSNAADSLIYIDTTLTGNQRDLSFSIPAAVFKPVDMSAVTGVKLMIKLQDNSTAEGTVKISPFFPPLPEFSNIPDTIRPDLSGGITPVSGEVRSESGLQTVIIEDDYQGSYEAVDSIKALNGVKSYALDYDYHYRKNASHLKITAVDIYGLTTSFVIIMPVLPYDVYKNVTMMAQGTSSVSSATCFFLDDGTLIGSCDISGREAELDLLTYANSSGTFYFYSPSNTGNVAKNFKCDGAGWVPDKDDLKDTRYRVLVPGSSATDAIYAAYNANSIANLDDEFFDDISSPSSHSVKYIPDESQAGSSAFNTTAAYLIWARIPRADGSFRNALIKVNNVNVAPDPGAQGLSTINFDIMLQ